MMALVLLVMAASNRKGSILKVSSRGSTGTTVAPTLDAASHVAMYVLEGTITCQYDKDCSVFVNHESRFLSKLKVDDDK
jgi:hypothetical protein